MFINITNIANNTSQKHLLLIFTKKLSMENFLIDKIEELAFTKVTKDEPLWESKILDSITIVELVVEIESEFSISVPFNEIVVDNFETVENMVNYITAKMKK